MHINGNSFFNSFPYLCWWIFARFSINVLRYAYYVWHIVINTGEAFMNKDLKPKLQNLEHVSNKSCLIKE